MGRPYASEMEDLRGTYTWALAHDTRALEVAIRAASRLPLLAVGSGGSLTTAHFLATAHEAFTGRLARHATPLDLVGHDFLDPEISVWILTAGGSNPDILRAFQEALHHEPRQIAAFCARTGSLLRESASRHAHAQVIDFDVPAGRDGFLATNSLLASVTLIARAYAGCLAPCEELPEDAEDLLNVPGTAPDLLGRLRVLCGPLWERDTLLVLHGPGTSSAAVDLESKFNEAALGHVQIADYRNFGHGRHHWLARRGATTAVLALETDADAALAERTLRLIPSDVAAVRLGVPGGRLRSQVGAVLAAILVAGLAGESRGIDPGRPGVPTFGSRLYRLSLGRFSPGAAVPGKVSPVETAAIERKAHASLGTLHCRGELAAWRRAYSAFKKRIERAPFGGVVFDYDGTLVDEVHRRDPPREDVAEQLRRLLAAGFAVGIATGRGDSARDDLRRVLSPATWPQVLIGYYNGAEVGWLGDDEHPDRTQEPSAELSRLAELIQADVHLSATCTCRERAWQLTVEPELPGSTIRVWERIQQLARSQGSADVAVVRSGHSIDILPAHVTKRNLVMRLREALPAGRELLCIGDRGCWPGNDFALLDDPFGLSVDEVSVDPGTCWNVAPRSSRGPQATIRYLSALEIEEDAGGPVLRFRTALLGKA